MTARGLLQVARRMNEGSMIVRNDIQGQERPDAIASKYLLGKGGVNPHGEPNFRLVWAPNRIRRRGGRFQDWDNTTSVDDRGGMTRLASGIIVPSGAKPVRIVEEMRDCKAYLFDAGWVIERWMPPVFYGSAAAWYSYVVPGTSIPLCGPYPEHGDYEMCFYEPSLQIPTISQLQKAIDLCERGKEQHRQQTEQIALERANEAQWAYDRQMEREQKESAKFLLDLMKPILSGSLGMGRHRTELAERAGIREHVGN